MKRLSPMTWALLVLLSVAVAGITHISTLLALPWHSADDAYARVSALVPPGSQVILPPPDGPGEQLPFRDPAMLTAVCRFDLAAKPLRLATSPFADGFVTVGFHSRHGTAFYGLTVHAADESSLNLVLGLTPETREGASETDARHDVAVTAPEPQGFITLSTPLGDGSERDEAEERLRHFECLSQPG